MINPVGAFIPHRLQQADAMLLDAQNRLLPDHVGAVTTINGGNPVKGASPNPGFGEMLGATFNDVNTKMQTAEVEKARVMSGETNNLHQAMLSIQEAGVAFSLMTEVRNKLVESYQEIMRMQV